LHQLPTDAGKIVRNKIYWKLDGKGECLIFRPTVLAKRKMLTGISCYSTVLRRNDKVWHHIVLSTEVKHIVSPARKSVLCCYQLSIKELYFSSAHVLRKRINSRLASYRSHTVSFKNYMAYQHVKVALLYFYRQWYTDKIKVPCVGIFRTYLQFTAIDDSTL
jgi:hypothetical protein